MEVRHSLNGILLQREPSKERYWVVAMDRAHLWAFVSVLMDL
jgi:hypothetical protein